LFGAAVWYSGSPVGSKPGPLNSQPPRYRNVHLQLDAVGLHGTVSASRSSKVKLTDPSADDD